MIVIVTAVIIVIVVVITLMQLIIIILLPVYLPTRLMSSSQTLRNPESLAWRLAISTKWARPPEAGAGAVAGDLRHVPEALARLGGRLYIYIYIEREREKYIDR